MIIPILKKFLSSSIQYNNVSKKLTHLVSYTAKFVKKNPNIIFIKANKDNITVALNKSTYISEIMNMLENPCSEGNLPRAYGLPKVYKPNCPFRIIISSLASPLYSLASYLHNF